MSLNLKIFYGTLIGAWGGLIAWAILDLLLKLEMENVYMDAAVNGLVIGVCIGVLVGGFTGLTEGSISRMFKGAAVGFATGLAGGVIGLLIGEFLFQALNRNDIGRLIGWSVFGLMLGLSEGIAHRSTRSLMYGGLGGLLGGLIGGAAFTLSRQTLSRPMASRAWGFAILGAFIGLFISLIPVLLKTAWLKVVSSGRDEGKEYIISKGTTTIGLSDSSDFGLYGDSTLQPVHAEIRQEQGVFTLYAKGPLTLNQAAITQHLLQDEDRIGMGKIKVRFKSK